MDELQTIIKSLIEVEIASGARSCDRNHYLEPEDEIYRD